MVAQIREAALAEAADDNGDKANGDEPATDDAQPVAEAAKQTDPEEVSALKQKLAELEHRELQRQTDERVRA